MTISPRTEERIINVWNNTDVHYSEHKTIHQLLEEMAEIQPDHIALVSSARNILYGELNTMANQAARQLCDCGVKSGTNIGILLPRSPEMIIVLYAVLKVGAAYVPLNITDPGSRIRKVIHTANIDYVITTNDLMSKVSESDKQLIILQQLLTQSMSLGGSNLNTIIPSETPAYIIFTSGTTGNPKGVIVKHRPVINLIEWVNRTFNIQNTDKLIWTTNLSFDLSVYDIFGIIAGGATVRILDDEERLDPKIQMNIILKENITFWDSAPQNMQHLIISAGNIKAKALHSPLRLVFLSGDWIPLTLPEEIKSVFNQAVVVGLGGATEATVWSNYFVVEDINPDWKSIPYGKPIQNARYYILDQHLGHCEVLSPGNLYIGGKCLASGYYNDQELTREKFIDDPFNPGSKLYKTGDLAQWMPDGNIEFLGRDDLQVKIRGFRVELGEIRNQALSIAGIKDCCVIADKTDVRDVLIYMFYIPKDTSVFDSSFLRTELKKLLPDYMLPYAIIDIEAFPLTPNGKTDQKALQEIAKNKKYEEINQLNALPFKDNLNETERQIWIIWQKVLGSANFSTNDNFFEIGGNSIHTYLIAAEIEKAFQIEISIKDFFVSPRIADLANLVEQKSKLLPKNANYTQAGEELSEKADKLTQPITTFKQLQFLMADKGYKFSIKNARLTCELPDGENDEELNAALKKYYNQLYFQSWPIPNANLTPIQPMGNGEPLFLVHGEQATPVLLDCLSKEIAIFDYFHQSLDGHPMKYKKVEAIAELYLSQLLKIKDDGNFILAGYSFGGLVAYEMALKLSQMNKNVRYLIIIDTPIPRFKGYIYNNIAQRIKFKVINPLKKWSKSAWRTMNYSIFLRTGKPIPVHLRNFYIVRTYERIFDKYRPQQFKGDLYLLTAQKDELQKDPYLGWGKYINGDIKIVQYPGNHKDMVKKPEIVKMWAETINGLIKTM